MSTLAMIEPGDDPVARTCDCGQHYIDLIQQVMSEKGVSLRALAIKAGISKSRLGRILHQNADERVPVTLNEFQALLVALDIDIIQAIIRVETLRDQKVLADDRYVALISMLASLFKGLPAGLVEALSEIDGLDGSEVRKEWASHLQGFVIKRMVYEVTRVMQRREQIFEERFELRN
jgi:transcriptional regulator with XRE-family HTH domain